MWLICLVDGVVTQNLFFYGVLLAIDHSKTDMAMTTSALFGASTARKGGFYGFFCIKGRRIRALKFLFGWESLLLLLLRIIFDYPKFGKYTVHVIFCSFFEGLLIKYKVFVLFNTGTTAT
jgi:hypothetical protein